jgi:hypothetical protein
MGYGLVSHVALAFGEWGRIWCNEDTCTAIWTRPTRQGIVFVLSDLEKVVFIVTINKGGLETPRKKSLSYLDNPSILGSYLHFALFVNTDMAAILSNLVRRYAVLFYAYYCFHDHLDVVDRDCPTLSRAKVNIARAGTT